MTALINLTGERHGRWLVLAKAPSVKGETHWQCRCDCGSEAIICARHLRTGASRSCGCLSREVNRNRARHGAARKKNVKRSHMIWSAMRYRCLNPNAPRWPLYGGRGISICERWNLYENFVADMGEPPPKYSIERTDNDGNYSPENCVWADHKTQGRNTRKTIFIIVNGERIAMRTACERHSIKTNAIFNRRKHMNAQQAFDSLLSKAARDPACPVQVVAREIAGEGGR